MLTGHRNLLVVSGMFPLEFCMTVKENFGFIYLRNTCKRVVRKSVWTIDS